MIHFQRMLKRIAAYTPSKYVAALVTVIGASLYVSFQYSKHSTMPQPSPGSQQVASFSHASEDIRKDTGTSKWNPPRWYRLFSWPDGTTVWGIVLTLIVIAEQTNETRKAAAASLRATRAAEAQIKHMVASERPWLLVRWSGDVSRGFTFNTTNVGKSPAKIVWIDPIILSKMVPLSEPFVKMPDYGFGYNGGSELVHAVWVEPGQSVGIGVFDSFGLYPGFDPDFGGYAGGDRWLYVFQAIKYRTCVDAEVHESRFCFRLGSGDLIMAGPIGSNDCT